VRLFQDKFTRMTKNLCINRTLRLIDVAYKSMTRAGARGTKSLALSAIDTDGEAFGFCYTASRMEPEFPVLTQCVGTIQVHA
jgi:hypothetical protein